MKKPFLNHSDLIENDQTITTVHGSLSYSPVSLASWLTGILESSHEDVGYLVGSYIYISSFQAATPYADLHVAFSTPWDEGRVRHELVDGRSSYATHDPINEFY